MVGPLEVAWDGSDPYTLRWLGSLFSGRSDGSVHKPEGASVRVSLGRVLVVDDEPAVALVLRDALADLGYEVLIAVSGREALATVMDFQPAVVLLDLKLPDLPGESVIDALRREAPAIPIVVVSGNSDAERARGLLQIGAFDYLAKPFQLSVLERVVAAAVLEHERRTS